MRASELLPPKLRARAKKAYEPLLGQGQDHAGAGVAEISIRRTVSSTGVAMADQDNR